MKKHIEDKLTLEAQFELQQIMLQHNVVIPEEEHIFLAGCNPDSWRHVSFSVYCTATDSVDPTALIGDFTLNKVEDAL